MKRVTLPYTGFLSLLCLLTALVSNFSYAQTISIYQGDSLKLNVTTTYRGTLTWQKQEDGAVWTDLQETGNNAWVKPTKNTYYRAKISDEGCSPVYSDQKRVLVSPNPGIKVYTGQVANFTSTTAVAGGSTTATQGSAAVIERGLCWSTKPNPTVHDQKAISVYGTGAFNASLSKLKPSTKYYVRAYAVSYQNITLYGNEITFTTAPALTLELRTSEATNITVNTALLGGEITPVEGSGSVIAKGICWSTKEDPTTSDNKTVFGSGTTAFSGTIGNLSSSTTYYARAYATTDNDSTFYGNQVSFRTREQITFALNAYNAADLTSTSASISVQLSGTGNIARQGICWSTSPTPTIDNDTTINSINNQKFTGKLKNLAKNTNYYARPYAITQEGSIVYGNQVFFRTLQAIVVSTTGVTDITFSSAASGGTVVSDGEFTIATQGVCWSNTSNQPTILNSKTSDISNEGSFNSSLTGLASETRYYLRAYATTETGETFYGATHSFETLPAYVFTVNTASATAITPTSATLNGNTVSMSGTGTIKARGVCWSTSPIPSLSDSKITGGSGPGTFNIPLNNLSPGTTYYARAYATSATDRTTYGNQITFTTLDPFTITTVAPTAITAATAKSGGSITVKATGVTVTARGICWSTSPTPTVEHDMSEEGAGAGAFASTMDNLEPNTKYYLRAYATSNAGKTFYGNEITLTTQAPLVINITTADINAISLNAANGGGTISTSGPGSVAARGICFSTEPNPTIENNRTSNGTGTGTFSSSLSGLVAGEKFYVRAYATTNYGATTYGNEVSFNTLDPLKVYTEEASIMTSTSTSLRAGMYKIVNDLEVTEYGICWSTSPSPTTAHQKKVSTTGTYANFTMELTGLQGNTTYYARAYGVTNTGVTIYGNEVSFKTMQPLNVNLTTAPATELTRTTAKSGLSFSYSGAGSILTVGICWSTSATPTYNDSKTTTYYNSALGSTLSYSIGDLMPNTTYYVRAYAITGEGIRYGNIVSFRTPASGIVASIKGTSEVTTTSAKINYSLTIPADEPATGKGICLSTNPNAPEPELCANGGLGSFNNNLEHTFNNLLANTTYYVKAYVFVPTGSSGSPLPGYKVYSNQTSFKTAAAPATSLEVTTSDYIPFSATTGTATAHGDYLENAGMRSHGFCWSTHPNPTLADKTTPGQWRNNISIRDGKRYPNFTGSLTNLAPGTTYYYRAYGVDVNGAVVYGQIRSITPGGTGAITYSVYTDEVKNVGAMAATIGWSVNTSGFNFPFEKGFCLGTRPNPTIADIRHKDYKSGWGTGTWSASGLIPATTYYVRAYAIDPGTNTVHYGPERTFTTRTQIPLQVSIRNTELSRQQADFYMDVTGEEPYTETGFCYSTTPNATVNDTKVPASGGSGYFPYTSTYFKTITGLQMGSTYYVKGYVRHSSGNYIYSKEVVFKTSSLQVVTTSAYSTGGLGYRVNAKITSFAADEVVERGVVWTYASVGSLPTLGGGYHTYDGSGTGDYSSLINFPSWSTRYLIRPYAKTSTGHVEYGNYIDYHTPSNPNPTPPPPPPPTGGGDTGGGDTGGGTTPTTGPGYLVFGRVFGPATIDCQDGSWVFDDVKGYAHKVVRGAFSSSSYKAASEEVVNLMKTRYPGDKNDYLVEASYNYDSKARYAVIIRYRKKIPGWNCTSYLVTIGYGTSYQDAQNKAVERKNKDTNGGSKAPYEVIQRLQW